MWPQRQEFNFGELTQQEIIPALEGVAVCHSMSQVATQLAEKYLKMMPVHIFPWPLPMHCFTAWSFLNPLATLPATQALHTLG